ncbi:isoprenoid synthase domain-containing protein [Mycena leptocephala]|nr:isoprenoid synthase domain-containing protein [Mycena leptocephala]
MRTPTAIILPDLLADWPFTASPNALQNVVADRAAWVESYVSKDAQAALIAANSGSSRTQRRAEGTSARPSDVASGEEVAKQAADIMEALRFPTRTSNGADSLLGAMTRSFWSVHCKWPVRLPRSDLSRISGIHAAVHQQAADRDEGRVRSIAEYLEDLPDEVVEHPHIQKLALAAIDLNILVNDLYSYNVEQSRGDDVHNMVTVAMREMGLGVQEAVDHVGRNFGESLGIL